jgi:hypothetical protein
MQLPIPQLCSGGEFVDLLRSLERQATCRPLAIEARYAARAARSDLDTDPREPAEQNQLSFLETS